MKNLKELCEWRGEGYTEGGGGDYLLINFLIFNFNYFLVQALFIN